ncbi:MAG: hypothetical protein R3B40_31850 [Polyangiales bacterium]
MSRKLLEEGRRLAAEPIDVSRLQAALVLQLSVETVMKTLLDSRGVSVKGKNADHLEKHGASDVPSYVPFRKYQQLRNSAQHEAVVPNRDDLVDMVEAARRCLEESFSALGHDFERFTLTTWVENPLTRDLLIDAEHTADALPPRARDLTGRVVRWVRHLGKHILAGASGEETWESYDPRNGVEAIVSTGDGHADRTTKLLEQMLATSLGFDAAEHQRHRDLMSSPSISPAEAWWLVGHAADQAYRLERRFAEARTLTPEETEPTAAIAPYIARRLRWPGMFDK